MMIDLHAHVLPGLDDGARDIEEAVVMCRMAAEDGVGTVVASPHMLDGVFNVRREDIIQGVRELRDHLNLAGISLRVEPGGDIHLEPDFCQRLRAGEVMTLADAGRYVLVELAQDVLPQGLQELLFSIQLAGVTPIISHPERNREVQDDPSVLESFVRAGNVIQVTAGSIEGAFGTRVRECVFVLLREGLAHVVASDAHSPGMRPPGLARAREVVAALLSNEEAEEIFVSRPGQILAGERVELPEPSHDQRSRWRRWFFHS